MILKSLLGASPPFPVDSASVVEPVEVFGEKVLLWACLLIQCRQRPAAATVRRHAQDLVEELRRSEAYLALPLQSADDGVFAVVSLLDEFAMSLTDLRGEWSQSPLQAAYFQTNNAGEEFFQRLPRVRRGPASVTATYAAALGVGFSGCYGLPGADRYVLNDLRRQLSEQLGTDPDRDWPIGALPLVRAHEVEDLDRFHLPFYATIGFARAIAAIMLLGGLVAIALRWLA